MRNWLLPEYIEDILPPQAQAIERLRARLLELFRVHGYELVIPPMLEYIDSLLTGTGHDLDLRTFKLVDQLSGRTMGAARRHHAAGGAHRRAPARPRGRDAAVLLRHRAAHAAARPQCDARAAADRRRDLRPRRHRERPRDPAPAARGSAGLRCPGRAARHRPRGRLSRHRARRRRARGARGRTARGADRQGSSRAGRRDPGARRADAQGAACCCPSCTAGRIRWIARAANCRSCRPSMPRSTTSPPSPPTTAWR